MKAALFAILMTVGCSDPGMPPPIGDGDGGVVTHQDGSSVVPCSTPAATCPCEDAGVGAQVYCGVIYRVSGKHVDCSPGYLTCQEDGTWSACTGAQVYDGN